MDEFQGPFQASLGSLLRQYFHVVPTTTQRHDQWYKRRYQSWANEQRQHGAAVGPLILAAKEARTEWAPNLMRVSVDLATHIGDETVKWFCRQGDVKDVPMPSTDKLFADEVLDRPAIISARHSNEKLVLTPAMQRLSFWSSAPSLDHADAIKALLERGHVTALVRLAELQVAKGGSVKDTVHIERKAWHGQRKTDEGWETLIDEILQVFFFLCILSSFPDELLAQEKYQLWLPYGGLLSNHTPMQHFTETQKKQFGKALQTHKDLQQPMERCLGVLIHTNVVHRACALHPISWTDRISDALLYFIGFEAWNREREGSTYLGCDLNTPKNKNWLQHGLTEDQRPVESASSDGTKMPKRQDPLFLREAKQEPERVPDEDEKQEQDKLDALATEEAAYGTRRSTKYRSRHANV